MTEVISTSKFTWSSEKTLHGPIACQKGGCREEFLLAGRMMISLTMKDSLHFNVYRRNFWKLLALFCKFREWNHCSGVGTGYNLLASVRTDQNMFEHELFRFQHNGLLLRVKEYAFQAGFATGTLH